MDPIVRAGANNTPISTADSAETAERSAVHARSLTSAVLSQHALDVLNTKEVQGNDHEKLLARLAKEGISSGRLLISPNQQPNSTAQFGLRHNLDVLVIKAELNERAEYDVLSVGFRSSSGDPIFMKLPAKNPSTEEQPRNLLPPNTLLTLPVELRQAIMQQVLVGDINRQKVYGLMSLESSCRELRFTLAGDRLLKYKHEVQKKIIGAVDKVAAENLISFAGSNFFTLASPSKKENCLVIGLDKFDDHSICHLGAALEAFNTEQRIRLVEAVLNTQLDVDGDTNLEGYDAVIGAMIGGFGSGLGTITDYHGKLIDFLMYLPDRGRCWAIYGLGKGLHALDGRLISRLLQAALEMKEEQHKAVALSGLAKAVPVLTELQLDAVFNAALQIQDDDEFTELIPSLCESMHLMKPEQQADLVTAIVEDEEVLLETISSLGRALKKIGDRQYINLLARLSESVLAVRSETDRARALGHLGAGLHALGEVGIFNDEIHGQLVSSIFDAVMGIGNETNKGIALNELGGGLSAFTSEQRNSFVSACLSMVSEENRGRAIAGLGQGLGALNHEQKEGLISATLRIADDNLKALAISGLGTSIRDLASEQQRALVDAAVNFNPRSVSNVLAALRDVEDIVQYSRLVDAALALPNNNVRGLTEHQIRLLAKLSERVL